MEFREFSSEVRSIRASVKIETRRSMWIVSVWRFGKSIGCGWDQELSCAARKALESARRPEAAVN